MKLTEEEIGKKTKKFIHDKIGDYAFLEYMTPLRLPTLKSGVSLRGVERNG